MSSNFQWPQPPYFELPPGAEFTGHEPALMMLVRGQKLAGTLSRFLPSHGTVEFLLERGRVNIDVPVADILQLRLTRSIVFKSGCSSRGVSNAAAAPAVLAASDCTSCLSRRRTCASACSERSTRANFAPERCVPEWRPCGRTESRSA